jgi:PAS domain S-box-containing protein
MILPKGKQITGELNLKLQVKAKNFHKLAKLKSIIKIMSHFDSEFLLHLMVDTTQSVIVVNAVDGTFLEVQVPHGSRHSGQEFVGKLPSEVLDKETASIWMEILKEVISASAPLKRELKFSFKQRLLWYDITVYPVVSADGEVERLITIGWDIEAKKAGEETLKKNRVALEEVIDESIAEVKRSFDQLLAEAEERRKIELALQRTQEDYKLIVENQNDIIVKTDPKGILLFVSPSCCKIFGKTSQELTGKSFIPYVHKDDLDATMLAIRALSRPPFHSYIEQRALTAEGYRWIAWVYTAVLNEKNKLKAIIGVGRDITDRKNAEKALNEVRRQYQSLVETVSDWIWEVDTDAVTTYCNPRSQDLIGYKPDELIGRPYYDFIEPSSQENAYAFFRNFADSSLPFSGIQSNFVHKNRKIVLIESNALPIFNSDSVLIGYRGVSRDITERNYFEQALRKSEQKLSGHLQQTHLGYIEWDINKEVLDWNPAAKRIFGFSRNEAMKGNTFSMIVPAELHQALEKIWQDILKGKNVHSINQNIRKDGERIHCEWFNTLNRNENNIPVSISSLVTDISARRQLEKEHKFLAELMEESNDIVSIATAAEQKIIFMNKAGRHIFGWMDNSGFARRSVNECHPAWVLNLLEKEWLPEINIKGIWRGDSAVLSSDGKEIPVKQIIMSHKNPEGQVEFYSTILRPKMIE